MKLSTIFSSSSLLLVSLQLISARRHHQGLTGEDQSEIEARGLTQNEYHIRGPNAKWRGIATSYEPDNNVPLSGACGWGNMHRNLAGGGKIYGAAAQTRYFAKGEACGQCLEFSATESAKYGHLGPMVVTVINECPNFPNPCYGTDLEVETMVDWLERPRVGQLNVEGKVVPCGFKKKGIFMEVYQYTTTIYDARFNVRGNSGPIRQLEIACSGTKQFLPMVKTETTQYTLVDMSKSTQVLKCPHLDFRFTNFLGEVIVSEKVPNKLNARQDAENWHNTWNNFERT